MASWHILQVAWGETSVEGHDNDYYRSLAKQRGGPDFENGYDLGWERNLQQFFNLGRDE
jgi:palmitoyltransferase